MDIIYYRDCTTVVYITASSFYHSLGRFLMTLSLRAQIRDPRYRCTRYFPRFFWDRHPFQIHRYHYCLVFISLFIHIFIYIMITDPFCRYSCTTLKLKLLCILYYFPSLRLSICTRLYFHPMYVAVVSPYLLDWGVTAAPSFFLLVLCIVTQRGWMSEVLIEWRI